MTTRADIAQVPFGDNQYQQVWAGIPGDTGTILLWNQDLNNTVFVGFRNSITIGGINTIPIPPNGMVTLGTDRTIYAIAAKGTANLVSIPGGGSFFRGLTQGLGQLVIPAIKSPNFVTGVSGWTINKDGSAEFNNVIIRGGTVITGLQLTYFPNPGFGNLISSDTNAAGVDTFGNAYLAGKTTYSGGGTQAVQMAGNVFTFYTAPGPGGPWTAQQQLLLDPANRLETTDAAGDVGIISSGKTSSAWVYAPVGNTAVATNIATYNIRANELHAGDIWEASFDGGFLLGATTVETLNFNLLLGGVASGGSNIAGTFGLNASGRLTITVRFNIATDGAAGTFFVGGQGQEASGATIFPLSFGNGGSPSAAFAVDTTIANLLALQASWGGAGGAAQRCNINFATLKKVA